MIPILILKPNQEPSADQIARVANGELQILTGDGEKVGIVLQRKNRNFLNSAMTSRAHSPWVSNVFGKATRLIEAFCTWCDARQIPCVSFEIENHCVDIASTSDSPENDVATAGRPFTKAGLVAVTELLPGKLWSLALSPWKISAGVLPLSLALQIIADTHGVWDRTSEPKSESGFRSGEEQRASGSQTIH